MAHYLLDLLYKPTKVVGKSGIQKIKKLGPGFVELYTEYGMGLTDAPWIFHVACGLGLLSGIIGPLAREPMFNTGPNLWILLLGPTTIFRKSTCLRIAKDLITTVAPEVILPTDFSPQALMGEFSARDGGPCVLFRDEVSGLFSSMENSRYMVGTKELLVGLFDGDRIERSLRAEKFTINQPFFVWMGGAVTERLIDSISEEDILSGLMVRFILVLPKGRGPTKPLRYEKPGADQRRAVLISRLQSIRERLAESWAIDFEDGRLEGASPRFFVLNSSALAAYNRYVSWLETSGSHDMVLERIHGRTIPLVLKLATLFGADHSARGTRSLINAEIISLPVLYKAIYWAEVFREHQIRILTQVGATPTERKYDRLVELVKEKPGITRGTAMRKLKLNAREMDEAIETLTQRGQLKVGQRLSKTRPAQVLFPGDHKL